MLKYKIKQIYLKNFKHIEEISLNFSNKDLVVLDGPNGFGKTTIFDAIELTLTGEISRIKNTIDKRLGYTEILFSNNPDIDTEVKIEFTNGIENLIIGKRINSSKRFGMKDKRPDNWGIFETYILDEFQMSIEEGKSITHKEIGDILLIDDIERYFSLFYYVQQEENTLFFKKQAKERLDDISKLFDTFGEKQELERLEKLKSTISGELRKITGPNGLLIEKTKTLKLLESGLEDIKKEDIKEVAHFSLLKEDKNIKEWDKELKTVNKESRDKFLEELRKVYVLVRDRIEFKNTQFNNFIYNIIENKTLLKQTIIAYNHIGNFKNIKKLIDNETALKRIQSQINKDKLSENLDVSFFIELNDVLPSSIDIDVIRNEIKDLQLHKARMGELSQVIFQLNVARESLWSQFNKLKEEHKDTQCPLCGSEFHAYDELIKSIDERKVKFTKMLDEDAKNYDTFYNEFYLKYIQNIMLKIEEYLSNEDNIVDEELYHELTQAVSNKSSINEVIRWCQNNKIEINEFSVDGYKKVQDLDIRKSKLTEFLLQQIKVIDKNYSNHQSNLNVLNTIFNQELNKVFDINLDDIMNKVKYIDFQYYYNSTESIKILKADVKKIIEKQNKLQLINGNIEDTIKVYKNQIIIHWNNIIRDIEIPFYIYSGKIIQNHQKGCGFFISENDDYGQKSIKFVSDTVFDHDAINYLSSGQLAGLAISLTLALNKVYGDKSIDLIMIDDPVQTMDEINIASMIEILRNEFKEKQIIISTHEEDVSRYMRYKFIKYNLSTKRINIKDKIYSKII